MLLIRNSTDAFNEPEKYMGQELELVLEEEEPVYPVFRQVYQNVTRCHPLACHMTVPHSPPALVMVLHQPQGNQPVQDTAEAECIHRTSGPADMLEGCKALAFVPYKGKAAFAHMQVVVSTGRRLVLGWAVQQQEVHR